MEDPNFKKYFPITRELLDKIRPKLLQQIEDQLKADNTQNFAKKITALTKYVKYKTTNNSTNSKVIRDAFTYELKRFRFATKIKITPEEQETYYWNNKKLIDGSEETLMNTTLILNPACKFIKTRWQWVYNHLNPHLFEPWFNTKSTASNYFTALIPTLSINHENGLFVEEVELEENNYVFFDLFEFEVIPILVFEEFSKAFELNSEEDFNIFNKFCLDQLKLGLFKNILLKHNPIQTI